MTNHLECTIEAATQDDHSHECRDCGATIECHYDSDECERYGRWGGGNEGCIDCELLES